jgi:hypothetical protein
MKHFLTSILSLIFFVGIIAQETKWPDLDVSTLDAAYYPQEAAWRNYLGEDQRNMQPKVKVLYSRPLKKGRDIFGDLVPFGKEWRLGANEATTITFYDAVDIGGTAVRPGTYTVFADVKPNAWTMHLSTERGIWGNANRDKDKTVASVTVAPTKVDEVREALAITFQEVDEMHCNMVIEWDQTRVAVPIAFNPIMFRGLDASPMDIAHYPSNSAYTNYLEGEEKNITPKIQVEYSRPFKKGRNVFGELIKPGDMWRIGANEASEIVLFEDMTVGGEDLNAGRYALLAEIKDGSWDIIFSKDFPSWGMVNRDESKDVARVNIPVITGGEVLENLSITFEEKSDSLVHMMIGWDQTRAEIPFEMNK